MCRLSLAVFTSIMLKSTAYILLTLTKAIRDDVSNESN